MTLGDFIFPEADSSNSEYFTLRDMNTKNHADDDDESQGGQMCSLPGNPLCPVTSLKMYLSKLNDGCQWMWQRPKAKLTEQDASWYVNAPLGKCILGSMLKRICKEAGCKMYTNHSLRATSISGQSRTPDSIPINPPRAELETENLPLTDSQLERVMEQIPDSIPINPPRAELETENLPLTDSQLERVMEQIPDSIPINPPRAELETENLPLTDSQLERVREQIPDTIPINPPRARQSTTTATGSTTYTVNVIDSKTRQPQYHFHGGCTVNIFNK